MNIHVVTGGTILANKFLVIVESPAKAKTIGKFLGRKYTVKASMGHVRDLPKSQLGVDTEHNFEPKYITIRGKGPVLSELRSLAKKADHILLAADPDREGEAISWHLAHLLGVDEKKHCRIAFNEITKEAVSGALKQARPINLDLVNAQQARRILDRLVGYNLSPLLWRKVTKGLSAGRVQSLAVRLICDREREIESFIPEEYWSITGVLTPDKKKNKFEAKLVKKDGKKLEIHQCVESEKILTELENAVYTVNHIHKKQRKRKPYPSFITSSLQQEAASALRFTARKTMMIAQQLYEGIDIGEGGTVGLITYIRTDSVRIAAQAQEDAQTFIIQKWGKNYVPDTPWTYKEKKGAQDAHEAIRPTSVWRKPADIKEFLSKDQYRLYDLIWKRFVASQMAAAVMDTLAVEIGAKNYLFKANGSTVVFPGFLILNKTKVLKEEEKLLPDLTEGQDLECLSLEPKQHFTQPPARYTEASLIKVLEENGVGRPSTYAPIIGTIQQRGYATKENRYFIPTELGFLIVDLLKEYFRDILDAEFTADMEAKLDKIAEGEMDWHEVLQEFYEPFSQWLEKAYDEIGDIEIKDEETDEICDKCGRNMVIKRGRFGKFLACPGFPECRNTRPLLKEMGVACPKPDCKGVIVERKTKKGRNFYGCSEYPACDFVTWDRPVHKKCPKCNAFLVEKGSKKTGKIYKCVREDCDYEEVADKD